MTHSCLESDAEKNAPYDAQATGGEPSVRTAQTGVPQQDDLDAERSADDAGNSAPYGAVSDDRPEIEDVAEPVLLDDANPTGEGIPEPGDPTEETYLDLNRAFRTFNQRLFNGELGHCLITFRARGRTLGYFSRNRYVNADGRRTHEIALNPEYFGTSTLEYTLSVLVHEQVHQAQHEQGTAGRTGYHNKDFAQRMRAVGLVASNTGLPGGNEVGPQMCHYVEPGGVFLEVARMILDDGFRARWADRYVRRRAPQWVPPADNPHVPPPNARPKPARKNGEDHGPGSDTGEDLPTEGDAPQDTGREVEVPLPGDVARPERTPPVAMPGGQPALVDQHPEDFIVLTPRVSRRNKVKFTCPKCRDNAWGKVSLELHCRRCRLDLVFADPYDPQVLEHVQSSKTQPDTSVHETAPSSQADPALPGRTGLLVRPVPPAKDRRRRGRNLFRRCLYRVRRRRPKGA